MKHFLDQSNDVIVFMFFNEENLFFKRMHGETNDDTEGQFQRTKKIFSSHAIGREIMTNSSFVKIKEKENL